MSAGPPVVLLHGLGRTRLAMLPLARALRREGFEAVNLGYFGPGGVALGLRQLRERLARRLGERAAGPLDFVTHSMGGIVARALLGSGEVAGRRLVQLAPPNQGAAIANRVRRLPLLARVPALWDLGRRAEGGLGFDVPPLRGVEVGVIAGRSFGPWHGGRPSDGVVRVEETYLPEARDWILLEHFHTVVMNARDTRENVVAFLRGGRFLPAAPRLERSAAGEVRLAGAGALC
ncbi:MAG: alpha/beta fold hydrolase [Planctomycetota bacterium]|nr:MAG: alpha/beta fold hydrolase [Planctomycetota bacterium]